jgi:hypothetical protein
LCFCCRYPDDQLHEAERIIDDVKSSGIEPDTHMLNILISGWSERANKKQVWRLLQSYFFNNVIEPNADTISFALEVLGKRAARSMKYNGFVYDGDMREWLTKADELLTWMETKGIVPTHHVIRDYVELLCLLDELDLASQVVRDFMGSDRASVSSKALYRLAVTCIEKGKIDAGMEFAALDEDVLMHVNEYRRYKASTRDEYGNMPPE